MIKGLIYDAKRIQEPLDNAFKYLAGLCDGSGPNNVPLVSKSHFTLVKNSLNRFIAEMEDLNKRVLNAQKKMKKNNH